MDEIIWSLRSFSLFLEICKSTLSRFTSVSNLATISSFVILASLFLRSASFDSTSFEADDA